MTNISKCEQCEWNKLAPNWVCGKCYQETFENPGELIPCHFRTCPKREAELKQTIIENTNIEMAKNGYPDGIAQKYIDIILNS